MKQKLMAVLLLALPLAQVAYADIKLETDEQKAAYAAGFQIGSGLQRDAGDLDLETMKQGMTDGYQKKPGALSDDQMMQAMGKYQQKRIEEVTTKNNEEAKKFLADNAKKPGIKTLPSGLQYQVLKEGKGASPQRSDNVKVNYHGTLLNGQVFDSSVQRGTPAVFGVGQVIPGWIEALQKMKTGDKWMLYIPPELAYGNRRAGPIEPGSLLVFEVELLEVLPAGDKAPVAKK